MKNIIILIYEPWIDKIPSLKSLILYLSKTNKVFVISSKDDKYPEPSFLNDNIKFILVKKRSAFLDFPTSLKLALTFLKCKWTNKIKFCIAGDYGCIILWMLNLLVKFRYIHFFQEYPQIITIRNQKLPFTERLKHRAIKNAQFSIVQDTFHKDFLIKHLGMLSHQFFILPNSTISLSETKKDNFLQQRLNIEMNKFIVLHSGGLGIWFRCQEIAESSTNWPLNSVLVFHTSHKVDDDPYFIKMIGLDYNGRVLFSTTPVDTSELDNLVRSASIGLAIYSKSILGYRAELMGLAAGKLGNYLKCGLPVIASDLVSFKYIEKYECGILVKDESEIAEAIKTIESGYKKFSENALKCYRDLWEPTRYLDVILKYIENN
jgi:glycosyltransferase involved in cell wall biosynthesis